MINAIPGDYQISLAGAIQTVQVVGSGSTTGTPIAALDPNIARNFSNGLIFDSTGAVTGAARGIPIVELPTATDSSIAIDPLAGSQPDLIPLESVGVPAPQMDDRSTPIRTTTPAPNERTVDTVGAPTDPIIDPTVTEIDPRIFQNLGGGIPPGAVANAGGFLANAFQNIVLTNNFFSTAAATGFGISAISQKPGGKVSEIGIFAVDDATGKIAGIAPGAEGYLQAASKSARSIFSTLGGSFFDSSSKREIALEPNKIYGFFEVQDGSIADLQQQLLRGKVSTNILSSLPDDKGNVPIQVTNNYSTGGYKVLVNNDELVLKVL